MECKVDLLSDVEWVLPPLSGSPHLNTVPSTPWNQMPWAFFGGVPVLALFGGGKTPRLRSLCYCSDSQWLKLGGWGAIPSG